MMWTWCQIAMGAMRKKRTTIGIVAFGPNHAKTACIKTYCSKQRSERTALHA